MIKLKPFLVSLLVTLGVGGLAGFLTSGSMEIYDMLKLPPLAPPPLVFPIVWTVLYILMGVSAYLVYMDGTPESRGELLIYAAPLAVNFAWPLLFFNIQAFMLSFLWLLLLLVLVLVMIVAFYKIKPLAAYLQIPYLVWILFAAYLNFGVWLLN